MKMQGERLIQAPQQDVWKALNDPVVLQQCIPGCEEMQKVSDNDFSAKVRAKVGPVSLTMTGDVHLSDLNPPASYRITGQGKGGAAGFARGGADIRLEDKGGATLIAYDVDAQVGGKLAQIGSRLIDSTARKMADDFFSRFVAIVESGGKARGGLPPDGSTPVAGAAAQGGPAREDAGDELSDIPTNQSGHLVLWLILAAVALAIVYYLFFRN
jgi:carbon monoxide dehydrogenase subunit G